MNFSGTIRLNSLGICIVLGAFIMFYIYVFSGITFKGIELKANVINLRKLLITAIEVAGKGGKEVKKVLQEKNLEERSKGKTKEGAQMLVTKGDSRSHCAMFYGLVHMYPHLKVISEESTDSVICDTQPILDFDPPFGDGLSELPDMEYNVEDLTVWIDPLDATQEYTENLLTYVTTMVCVAHKGKPIIGVIHKPFEKKPLTYWAWLGQKYSPSLDELFKSRKTLSRETLIVSRSHAGNVKNVTKEVFGSEASVIPAGGAGYKTLAVIGGDASLYLHTTIIKKWDICAGDAIIQAVGGRMTTLNNMTIDYSYYSNETNEHGIIASLSNHDDYVKRLRPIFNKVAS